MNLLEVFSNNCQVFVPTMKLSILIMSYLSFEARTNWAMINNILIEILQVLVNNIQYFEGHMIRRLQIFVAVDSVIESSCFSR